MQQFAFTDLDDAPTQVTWQLEPVATGTRVQITHVYAGMTKTYRRTKRGWPALLANLDTLLTRGRLPWSTRLQNAMMAPAIRLVQRLKGRHARIPAS